MIAPFSAQIYSYFFSRRLVSSRSEVFQSSFLFTPASIFYSYSLRYRLMLCMRPCIGRSIDNEPCAGGIDDNLSNFQYRPPSPSPLNIATNLVGGSNVDIEPPNRSGVEKPIPPNFCRWDTNQRPESWLHPMNERFVFDSMGSRVKRLRCVLISSKCFANGNGY